MILSNQAARHTALYSAGLHTPPNGPCNKKILFDLIQSLGYVQQDPLQVIARAHDHILWSRNNQYRPRLLNRLMEEDRLIFEHFCHDACVLPVNILPYWTHQFKRRAEKHTPSNIYRTRRGKQLQAEVLDRIEKEGPLCSKDFKSPKGKKPKVWAKPEHKQVLDYLWLNGDLAVAKRVKFSKYYDLAERIYPQELLNKSAKENVRLDYLAVNAIERLGFGTAGDIMRFWEACSLQDVRHWCRDHEKQLVAVSVESADGEYGEALSHQSLQPLLKNPPPPTSRLRILNPFDPIMRDRKRLQRLFGFEYRIEIYVPAEKRQYGYYVYPILEFDRFVGRIEVRHDKTSNTICVDNLWPEQGIQFGKGRLSKLNSELQRLQRFCAADSVQWSA